MRYVCAMLLGLSCGWLPLAASALEATELFQQSRGSVALVMSFDENGQPLGIGSGFFVDDGAKLVTNLHVVEGASSVRIRSASGEVQEIDTSLGVDRERDLILLSVPSKGAPLELAQREPEIGEDVIAIGNPRGLEGTLSVGIVSGIRNDEGSVYYQITAPISPGSSGGPVIETNGTVLGVSTFYVDGGQNLNFAMPAAYITRMLRAPQSSELRVAAPPAPNEVVRTVDQRVRISGSFINGGYGSLEASIVNGTETSIKNIRLLAIYYGYYAARPSDPLHYSLINIPESIPPGLAERFERVDPTLNGHGTRLSSRGRWTVQFRILDYEIEESSLSIPLFE